MDIDWFARQLDKFAADDSIGVDEGAMRWKLVMNQLYPTAIHLGLSRQRSCERQTRREAEAR